MQGIQRRFVYVGLFEAIAIVMTGIGLMLLSGKGAFDSGALAVVTSAVAVAWNFLFTTFFERWEARLASSGRSLGRRIAHAFGFEIGLILLLVPLFAWWLDVSLWQALIMNLSLTLFFLFYTFGFNWAFDLVFGLPLSAR